MNNPYEENEFEREDHHCRICGRALTFEEWEINEDLCIDCVEAELDKELRSRADG